MDPARQRGPARRPCRGHGKSQRDASADCGVPQRAEHPRGNQRGCAGRGLRPAVLVTWQIGSREASAAGREFIEPEDIFIGLSKLDEILTGENVTKLLEEFGDLTHLRQESERLSKYFAGCNLDRLSFRRLLRGYLGLGTHAQGALNEPVHRSEACKRVFQKALEIAEAKNSPDLHSFHLLAALLEAPSPAMSKAIERCCSTV